MKNFDYKKYIFVKMTAMCTLTIFYLCFNRGNAACAMTVHTQADQLLPQLLMDCFNTLPLQCRHIGHLHE